MHRDRPGHGMVTVKTVELIRLIHDGLDLLENYARQGDADAAQALGDSCESLLSAVVLILREPKGKIPAAMQYHIGAVREHLLTRKEAA